MLLSARRATVRMRMNSMSQAAAGKWQSSRVQIREMSVALEEILMPALSPTMEEGNISEWKAAEGEELGVGDIFCSVETDKATVDFEATDDTVLAKILVGNGTDGVKVGQLIGYTVEDLDEYKEFVAGGSVLPDSSAPAAAAAVPEPVPAVPAAPAPAATGARVPSIKFLGKRSLLDHPPAAAAAVAAAPAAAAPATAVPSAGDFEDLELSNMRKVIAKRLTANKKDVPHQYSTVQCEIDGIGDLRAWAKNELGVKLSVNDFVVRASALALRDVRGANVSWDTKTNTTIQSPSVDVCVAVATPTGLITPIVTNTDTRGLSDIHDEIVSLATKAKDNKLQPHEFMGGSFTISNLGMFGISEFTAIINAPGQGCILAVGGGVKQFVYPSFTDEQLASVADEPSPGPRVATTMNLTLSSDAQCVDQATAAQFLQVLKAYLENPKQLML